ncbi:AraC family transcriptional regulator [Burkholderia sp. R-69608]|uniref:AraC family transcriptional regulator n=1 Tax=Paraburkholderia nemoris TaxID=2793076 RepID=UPI001914492D|nr:AraC family transcriptional regulator [Paraburkholderia nemoris]MBK5151367.1 AraC family transcriptional regulator [Burkholderia sp. R-69608]
MTTYTRPIDETPHAFLHFDVEIEGKAEPELIIDRIGRSIKPHKMSLVGTPQRLETTFRSLKLAHLQIFYLRYGAAVEVDPGELGDFTLVQMPVYGAAWYTCGKQEVVGSRDVAAIISPKEATQMRFSSELKQVIVRIDQKALEKACLEHLDLLPNRGIRFEPLLDLTGPAGRAWRSALSHVLEGSENFPDLLSRPAYAERCERLLMDSLLLAQPSSCTEYLNSSSRQLVRPAYVRRAEEFMRDRLADIASVEEIASYVGVSPRALFYAFRRTHDQSPMAYLRELRLKAVHAELRSSNPATTRLTDVAMQWGFAHYGHFTSHYRRRFGVRPQDTLNACRS